MLTPKEIADKRIYIYDSDLEWLNEYHFDSPKSREWWAKRLSTNKELTHMMVWNRDPKTHH